MFDPDMHIDPLGAGSVLAEAGIDYRAVSEVIADERAIRCPERAAVFPERRFADLVPDPPAPGSPGGAAGPFLPRPSRRPVR